MGLKLLLKWYAIGLLVSMGFCLPISYGLHAIGSMGFGHSLSLTTSLTCFLLLLVLAGIAMRRACLPRPKALEEAPEEERDYYLELRERLSTALIALLLVMISLLAVALVALAL